MIRLPTNGWFGDLWRRRRWPMIAGAGILLAGGGLGWARLANSAPTLPMAEVKRGEFVDTLEVRGEVKALKAIVVAAPSNAGDLQIVALVKNGTVVKQGDVVVQFDSSRLVRTLEEKRSELKAADARHDGLGEAIYHLLRAYAAHPECTPELADRIAALLATFIPRLGELHVGYAAQAAAGLTKARALPAHADALQGFPVALGGGSLKDWVEAFVAAGGAIDDLLDKRAGAKAAVSADSREHVARGAPRAGTDLEHTQASPRFRKPLDDVCDRLVEHHGQRRVAIEMLGILARSAGEQELERIAFAAQCARERASAASDHLAFGSPLGIAFQ